MDCSSLPACLPSSNSSSSCGSLIPAIPAAKDFFKSWPAADRSIISDIWSVLLLLLLRTSKVERKKKKRGKEKKDTRHEASRIENELLRACVCVCVQLYVRRRTEAARSIRRLETFSQISTRQNASKPPTPLITMKSGISFSPGIYEYECYIVEQFLRRDERTSYVRS